MIKKLFEDCECCLETDNGLPIFCSAKCVSTHEKEIDLSDVHIALCTPSDVDIIPNGITKLTIYYLHYPFNNCVYDYTIDKYRFIEMGRYIYFPCTIEEIIIHYSCFKEHQMRLPYGCKLFIRNCYQNAPEKYEEVHDFIYDTFNANAFEYVLLMTERISEDD